MTVTNSWTLAAAPASPSVEVSGPLDTTLVFPTSLPGCDIRIQRIAEHKTGVKEALSRKTLRSTWETYPLTRYKVDFNVLRSDSAIAGRAREWQILFAHVARHYGQAGSFLITDPDDCSVAGHGFALGDGATLDFQLQRTLAGDVTDAAGFTYRSQTVPYTNLLKNSSFESDANADGLADGWGVYNNSASTEFAYGYRVPGLNGGMAQRISWGTPTTNTKGIYVPAATPPPSYSSGVWYTLSFFARADGSNVGKFLGTGWNAPAPTIVAVSNPPLSTTWQRYVFQISWAAGVVQWGPQLFLTISNTANGFFQSTASFGNLDFDLVQLSTGQWGANDLQPIETPASATATRIPALWPSMLGGYEPIFDLAGTPAIYVNGTAMIAGTDYTVGASGVVSFLIPPPAGAILTWGGTYYRRVRFAQDNLSSDRLGASMWEAKSVALVSVKP